MVGVAALCLLFDSEYSVPQALAWPWYFSAWCVPAISIGYDNDRSIAGVIVGAIFGTAVGTLFLVVLSAQVVY